MTSAEVFLWGSRIGIVTFEDGDSCCSFQYDPDFVGSRIEVSPIVMPLSSRVYRFPGLAEESFHGLPGLLADSLPDKFGNALIDTWAALHGRGPSPLNAVERLCYTGTRGMGALEFFPSLISNSDPEEIIRINELVELASAILTERRSMHLTADQKAMQQILRIGTSAGGARAKAVIAWNPQTNIIRSGQIQAGSGYEYWLIKFDHVDNNRDKEKADGYDYTRIEYAYYLMALHAGITMSDCRLYEEDGCYHFMTRRFDRDKETGAKIHMQTLGGIAHFDFNIPGAYSYEQASGILRRLHLGQEAVEQFFRRMVFNILAWNQDDHVKNISFLMDRNGTWSLSPAYDVTYAYNPGGLWTGNHQMTVNGKRNNISLEDLKISASSMDIRPLKASQIIEQVEASIRMWPTFADRAHLPEETMKRISDVIAIP